jgi:hypothetical protein
MGDVKLSAWVSDYVDSRGLGFNPAVCCDVNHGCQLRKAIGFNG